MTLSDPRRRHVSCGCVNSCYYFEIDYYNAFVGRRGQHHSWAHSAVTNDHRRMDPFSQALEEHPISRVALANQHPISSKIFIISTISMLTIPAANRWRKPAKLCSCKNRPQPGWSLSLLCIKSLFYYLETLKRLFFRSETTFVKVT